MSARIPLHGKHGQGKFALVDVEDYGWLSRYRWYGHKDGSAYTVHYAGVYAASGRGIYPKQFMHRFIAQPPGSEVVDHINGIKIDNRKANLRVCSQKDNVRNQRPIKGGASRYKGAHRGRRPGSWDVYITCDGYFMYLGRRYDEQEAALLYDAAAIQLFGDFANLNLLDRL